MEEQKDNGNGELKKEEPKLQPLEIHITFHPYSGSVDVKFPQKAKVACLGMLEMASHLIAVHQEPEDKIIPAKHGILNFARGGFRK